MRLLKLNSEGDFGLETFSKATIPSYAILSHTWGRNEEEVTFAELIDGTARNKKGYQKLQFCNNQATADGYITFGWTHVALTNLTTMNSQGLLIPCFDGIKTQQDAMSTCQTYHGWFRRGRTLQDLLAPRIVEFYPRDHVQLGDKTSLKRQIHEITAISLEALRGRHLYEFTIEERFSWGERRQTTEEEDMAYCLLGIFDIFLPLIYGEGQASAMRRLRKEIKESATNELHSANPKLLQTIPFKPTSHFTGRQSKLSKLETLLSQSSQITSFATTGQSSLSSNVKHTERVCNCRNIVVQNSSKRVILDLKFFSQTAVLHREDCPYSRRQKVTKKVGLKINHVSNLIGAAIQASFTLQFGAGDLSIIPYLGLRGFARKNSPAFTLFDELGWDEAETLPQYVSITRQIPKRLHLLFTNGEASPGEIDERGNTLLLQAWRIISRKFEPNLDVHPRFIEERNMLLKSLFSLGVPSNERTYLGENTVLDLIIFDTCYYEGAASSSFIGDLNDLGAEFYNSNWKAKWTDWFDLAIYGFIPQKMVPITRLMVETMQTINEFAEVCGSTVLEFAILSKSKSKVASIIARDPEAVTHRNLVGQSPLHMAANWPWTLDLLLDSGADVSAVDEAGILPLSYACFFECHEAVKMLLSAESPLSSAGRRYTILDDSSITRDVTSFELVAKALAQHRIQVLDIARSILPIHALDKIIQSKEQILDAELSEIIQALKKSGLCMDPHYFCFTYRSVYHTRNLPPGTADVLYELGFKKFEGRDKRRLTPLANIIEGKDSQVEMIPWFVLKGANIDQELDSSVELNQCLKEARFVAAGISTNLCDIFSSRWRFKCTPLETFSDHGIDAIRVILGPGSTDCYDNCSCLCSSKGCSPLSMILKTFWRYVDRQQRGYQRWSKDRIYFVDWILEIDDLDPPTKHRIYLEALRMLLFDETDLTHTCCKPEHGTIEPPMDYAEALEVADEETEIISHFEVLLGQAELEWRETSEFFSQFLFNFIRQNISRRHGEKIDNEYAQALRNIGVQLQEVSDDDDDEEEQEEEEEDNDEEDDEDEDYHGQFEASSEVISMGSVTADALRNKLDENTALHAEQAKDKQELEAGHYL